MKKDPSGLLIPAGLFIGLGLGYLYDKVTAYMLLGLGLGFLGTFLIQMKKKK